MLENAVAKITEFRKLKNRVEIEVKERYSSTNEVHEAALAKVHWTLLFNFYFG